MNLEPNQDNIEFVSELLLEELIEEWGNKPFEGNIKNISRIRKMTGWDLNNSALCYNTLIRNHPSDLKTMGYLIISPLCIYKTN